MTKQDLLFKYNTAQKISTWGCHFDSLTELKFFLSIADDYTCLRSPVSIYYHPGTKQPSHQIRLCCRRYTPDFLIRHKETGAAFLIEIKPRAFEGHPQLLTRKEVAENYIRKKGYDWQFMVVFDDEIILSEDGLEDFHECSRMRSRSEFAAWFRQYNQRVERRCIPSLTAHKKIEFVIFSKR